MATLTKCRKGIAPSVALVFFFVIPNLASAETKVFVEDYTYQASEADSKLSSRVIALEQVERLLLEKLGAYLESETEVKNFQLTKDQIVILTAGIVRAEIIDEKWDGKTYSLKAKIAADPKEVANSIDKLRYDRQKTKELEQTKRKAEEALGEVEKLRKELEIFKGEKPNLNKYNEAVNSLIAIDWLRDGWVLRDVGKWQEARNAFTKSIELDPKNELAYVARGLLYHHLRIYQQAIKDYDKAIELLPNQTSGYVVRGMAYQMLREYRQAIRDYDKAIELDPMDAGIYFFRGAAYDDLGDNRQAIRDYDKAIELDPKNAAAYKLRGYSYRDLGDNRQAIKDYDKAIELDPKNAAAFLARAVAYGKLGKPQQAINDYKTAAGLGHKEAQDYLRSRGISW